MMKRTPLLSVLAVAAVLAACSTPMDPAQTAAPVETRSPGSTPPAQSGSSASASGTSQSHVATVDLAAQNAAVAVPAQRVVYFDFDSFVIKDEFRPTIDGFARVLSSDKAKRLIIEGHTDERGGREYNLALGQKRAEAVVRSLALLGASEQQVEAVSFGEERPADTGHDEAAWAKNRRAELKDR